MWSKAFQESSTCNPSHFPPEMRFLCVALAVLELALQTMGRGGGLELRDLLPAKC